jgi:hypothetical protein
VLGLLNVGRFVHNNNSTAFVCWFDDNVFIIDEKTLKYLIPDSPKPGRFYLLPKIHKANNPGRPIVSANGHPTEKISESFICK